MATRPSVRRHSTVKVASPTAMPPRKDPLQRRSTGGLLASLFGPPPRHTTTVFQKDVARVTCIVCMADDLPASKTAKLNCGHRRCNSCLQRQFLLSVNDPQQMPPRCCTNEHIPLKHVERLFNDKFKRTWNKKYQEYTTANRLYCPTKGCGEWIKPSKIRVDIYGRKFARCGRCHTKVCVLCNGKFHTRRDCPMDPETNRLVQIAKEKGWQRCYHCKAIVELKEGCNHMTCRCNAQFCMVCAAPWKTCNCPWFNYQHIEDEDRLDDMRIPQEREGGDMAEPPTSSPPLVRRISTRARNRSDRDRDAERADEVLAAHLHAQLNLDGTRTPSDVRRSDPGVQVYGLGNAGSHHMNESYRIRPLTVSVSRAPLQRAPPGWSSRQPSAPAARHVPSRPALVRASTMAGLSRDGSKRGANRVGTWLSHVQVDHEAIQTAPRHVEVDDWRMEGSVAGIP
ncbi:hypothetical protein M011DRAFT_246368 [Sporormia fimetaria CBS 119925]|uniref:RBR-type E3 ubiquitin transferase n=1 Tax=Sporormia fimetaria CBS 119925 TaxID=1340428 RepID=A0A6A6V0C1_9PLEO|nr:hypothetical protein M011DRAFT_246368 [Sporormia fimetaria CBS 119925]